MEQEIDYDDLEALLKATEPTEAEKRELSLRSRLRQYDPDTLYSQDYRTDITFMYKNGELTYKNNVRHLDLANGTSRFEMLAQGYLLGRIGMRLGVKIVTFWHKTSHPLIAECLLELLKKNLIDHGTYIVGDYSPVITCGEYLGKTKPPRSLEYTPKIPDHVLRKMHTLPGSSKKALMATQGYKPNMPSRNHQGNKWWAPTSEWSFREWLRM